MQSAVRWFQDATVRRLRLESARSFQPDQDRLAISNADGGLDSDTTQHAQARSPQENRTDHRRDRGECATFNAHGTGRYAAQHDSFATSLVNACAVSFIASESVKYG